MFTVYSFQLYTHNLLYRSVQYFNVTTEALGSENFTTQNQNSPEQHMKRVATATVVAMGT